MSGSRYRPRVFRADGRYTVWVGEPGTDEFEVLEGLVPGDTTRELRVNLRR